MRFDDRLTTVLAQPAGDAHDRAVRWRQLVELLARGGGDMSSPVARQALDDVRADSAEVDEGVRAAAARAVAGLRLPVDLIALFAADTLAVAAPILASAKLSPEQWQQVRAGANPETARFIASLHPDLPEPAEPPPEPLPQPEPIPEPLPEPAPAARPAADDAAMPSISELVARIERLRRTRQATSRRQGDTVRGTEPTGGPASLFRWESTASGEIAWVEGVPRGALIGRSLANAAEEGLDPRVERAFALRAPFRDAPLNIAREGALAGEWRISGMPAFRPSDGRFAGYRGVGMRAAAEPGAPPPPRSEPPDHDALRELVHEIKTPLNAILGFAEIIERQYLGPADRRYRTRAGEIIAQARVLLEAIDDLDLAAKLQSAGRQSDEATDLAGLLDRLAAELGQRATEKGATVVVASSGGERCRLPAELGERLVRRFLLALVDGIESGEALTVRSSMQAGRCLIAVDRPRLLASTTAEQLLVAAPSEKSGTAEALAFSLRLVRGLARIVGGDLETADNRLTLALPA